MHVYVMHWKLKQQPPSQYDNSFFTVSCTHLFFALGSDTANTILVTLMFKLLSPAIFFVKRRNTLASLTAILLSVRKYN